MASYETTDTNISQNNREEDLGKGYNGHWGSYFYEMKRGEMNGQLFFTMFLCHRYFSQSTGSFQSNAFK